jgi:hypothetical protein
MPVADKLTDIIWMIKSERIMGEGMQCIWSREITKNLFLKPEVKRLLGRSRHRWEDIIKMNL